MIAFAYGVASAGDLAHAGWLHGLKLAAVAVVAQAVWGMGKNLCPDRTRVTMCVAAAAAVLMLQGAMGAETIGGDRGRGGMIGVAGRIGGRLCRS